MSALPRRDSCIRYHVIADTAIYTYCTGKFDVANEQGDMLSSPPNAFVRFLPRNTQDVENLFLGLRRNDTSLAGLLLPVVRVTQDASIKTTLVEREPVFVRFEPHRTIEDVVARVIKQRSASAHPGYTEKVDPPAFRTRFGKLAETTIYQLEV